MHLTAAACVYWRCRFAPPGVRERFYADAGHAIGVAALFGVMAVLSAAVLCLAELLARRRARQ